MNENSDLPANVTVIIRCVKKISLPAEFAINLLSQRVNQILILFSGSEIEYKFSSSKYQNSGVIEVVWVYSFGYLEPIMSSIYKKIRNQWMMVLTDRDIPSEEFVNSLNMLIQQKVNGFLVQRVLDDDTAKRNIPSWLKYYTKPGFKYSFTPLLYRKNNVVISEIIHEPPKIIGKTQKLDSSSYYVRRVYTADDMENDETFVDHWITKELRYIFIELFETRKSRIGAIQKIIEYIPILRKKRIKKSYHNFLNSELSNIEYVIFEFFRSLSMGSFGLTPYQKVKLETIKETRKFNTLGFLTSEFMRTKNESLIDYLTMGSSLIDKNENNDMTLVEGSEFAFIKRLLIKFKETKEDLDYTDVDQLISKVKKSLNVNANRYMPRN